MKKIPNLKQQKKKEEKWNLSNEQVAKAISIAVAIADQSQAEMLKKREELSHKRRHSVLSNTSVSSALIKKPGGDQGLDGNWNVKWRTPVIMWTIFIVGAIIYKIVDMNTLQWFGRTIYFSKDTMRFYSLLFFFDVLWFSWCVLFFLALVGVVLSPILKFCHDGLEHCTIAPR